MSSSRKVELFDVRNKGEWATIVLVDDSQCLIHSTFGSWGYGWYSIGEQTLRQFLCEADRGYVMSKLARKDYLDIDSTIKQWKRLIIECLRSSRITKEQARTYFDEIAGLDECDNALFHHSVLSTDNLLGFIQDRTLGCDYDYCPQFRGFMDTIWPAFIEQMKEEVGA